MSLLQALRLPPPPSRTGTPPLAAPSDRSTQPAPPLGRTTPEVSAEAVSLTRRRETEHATAARTIRTRAEHSVGVAGGTVTHTDQGRLEIEDAEGRIASVEHARSTSIGTGGVSRARSDSH